ncbi:hypothetical protein [Thiolapillus sp.]|uniref:hypothetical protein n=1 Tax=Thiolapillus sp. TaxID=2017437 RepID=UPI003AF77B16
MSVARNAAATDVHFDLQLPRNMSSIQVDKELLRIAINNLLTNEPYAKLKIDFGWLNADDCQDSCPIFYATFSLTSCSSVSDFSGFNQTSLTGSQFRVSRIQRSGFRCFADS